jgi:mono/diheme cytochrome c family protein
MTSEADDSRMNFDITTEQRRGRVTIGGVALAAIAVVALLLASGCGYGGVASAANHPDAQNGQTLFKDKCGFCHTLAAANTTGTVGPNLDNAFAGSRKQGYGQSTIENVVLDQIRLGSISPPLAPYATQAHFTSPKCLGPETKKQCYGTPMQANIVTGQEAYDVAAYVASVAGVGGFTTAACGPSLGLDGLTIFKGCGCGGCHTLKAAGSTGNIGPNLDQLGKALTVAVVANQVTVGGAPMPSFKDKLTPAQIQAVAKYVSSVAGR